MTYDEAVKKINSLLVFGVKPGLERISEFIRRIGSPDKNLNFVHVAGTNGKGSVCSFISSALTKSGYKTGLFISPYVLEFRERFMIDGEMISHDCLADIVGRIFPVAEEMKKEGKIITEFEFIFAAALIWYSEQNCDIVVLETGLGGRFDATNIITKPLVSVITSISLDHTKILGDTFSKIAFEKCGIIKPNCTTVAYADQPKEAAEVIRNSAAEKNNRLIFADTSCAQVIKSDIYGTNFIWNYGGSNEDSKKIEVKIKLIGEHQIKNACTALAALSVLREKEKFNIPDYAIQKGFSSVSFPARMELLEERPPVFLDGAHNPGGTAALAKTVKKYLDGKYKIGIIGMLADKDIETALSEILPLFDEIITLSPKNPRAMKGEELAKTAKKYCKNVTPMNDDYAKAYQKALSKAENYPENGCIIIFGSLYLAGDIRKIIINSCKKD